MKRSFIISSILHAVIISSLFFFSPTSRVLEGYPTIYRVGLVSLPSGSKQIKGGQSEVTQAKITAPQAEEKGVSVKEFRKTRPKKTSKKTQKETPAKTPTVASGKKQDEGKITEKDELGAEYGLGNGISAATVDGIGFGSPYYLSLVFGRIRDLWDNPVQTSATVTVTIYFKILREGQIIHAQVEKSSGIELFDQSAMRAVLSSAPLPPLPVQYTGEYLGIHLEFEYVR